MLFGKEKVWRKALRFLSQGISLDERFPKPDLITPTQASGALALLSFSGRGVEGKGHAWEGSVCLWRAWQSGGEGDAAVDVAV